MLAIPLAATVLFAAWGVVSTSRQARAADRLQTLAAASTSVGEAVIELSRERLVATQLVSNPAASVNPLLEQVARTDRVVEQYRQRRGQLDADDAAQLLAPFDAQVALLPALREQIRNRAASRTAVLVRYRVAIAQGLAARDAVGQVGGADGQIADRLRVAAAVSRASEYAGIQQATVVIANGVVLTPAVQQELAATRAGYDEALQTVVDRSPGRWRAWLDQALTGPDILTAQRLDDEIARARAGTKLRLDAAGWTRAASERRERLRGVQSRIDADITADVARRRAEQWTTTLVLSAVAMTLVAAAGVLALRQGRALARRLRQVRDAVTGMAAQDLPDLVRRVSNADPADPAAMPPAPAALAPARGSRDEVDEVATAFDTLALTTYHISTDLARQRRVASAAVEAVGRRCQGMTHRLLQELDTAERDEKDAATLATFFAVDNLAAQLLQFVQNLLVLSGRSVGTVHHQPAPLATVAQAAQGRIQEYRRVMLGMIDERVLVPPALIDDLVHLLASLLDNATRYSPGDALLNGHLLGNRVLIQITDSGTGINPDLLGRLNAELAAPAPQIEVEHIRRQGLATVAALAASHGLAVRLIPAQPHGTVAEVEIPAAKLLITAPQPVALPSGPIAGRRAPGGTPASTLTLPAPVTSARREAPIAAALPARRRPQPPRVDAPTQVLPVVPAPRRSPEQESTPAYDETARRLPPPSWFVEGATVHMPASPTPFAQGHGATTPNGLPKRQPMAAFAPPPLPAADVPPRPAGGLARTAAAYQRGLSRRPHQPKGQP
ncbi:nitrate- and nitrite sensing domain-containing protein [Micromonospora endolithica]|uniref:sensor histidine kinase n=1 Tax=Micromonospora endolithica TaxID=230091 RepID=UPI0011AD1709|nr:nitrate- and nitrite sensing domain-containing protein [Micromonospora endolithica]TWJ20865.1 histidine kinase/DNA gyrase B/HSP90-like ATPase [Micromonospora endolithica]